jgi:hypothetical protein
MKSTSHRNVLGSFTNTLKVEVSIFFSNIKLSKSSTAILTLYIYSDVAKDYRGEGQALEMIGKCVLGDGSWNVQEGRSLQNWNANKIGFRHLGNLTFICFNAENSVTNNILS